MDSPGMQSENNVFHAAVRFRPILLLVFLAFVPANVSGDAAPAPVKGTRGVQVTREVPFASETFGEVRSAAPGRPVRALANRAIPSRRIDRHPEASTFGTPLAIPETTAIPFSVPPAASVPPRAPALDASFAGLGNPPRSQGDVIPPDTMGAAGPNHLVSILNSDFGVFDKSSGAILQQVDLQSFWASLGTGPGEPAHFPFDPKILYDPGSGRFFAVTLGGEDSPGSWIMVAVSSSSDPNGTWNKWAIDADLNNGAVQTNNSADYPGFGIDEHNVFITANMFSALGYQYSKIWVIPKTQLLSGANSLTWTEFPDPLKSNFISSLQPAHTFGQATAEYFVFELGSSRLGIGQIVYASGTPVWQSLPSISVSSFTSSVSLPGAPQLGSDNTIDTSDTRLLGAVYRANSLWTVHHVQSPGVVKTEVAWYEIDPLPASPALKSSGRISDPARWYYYPSIGVNANGDVAVGMSGSSTNEYVGGFYTTRRFEDPAGFMQAVSLLKAGEHPYYKTFTGSQNRWGDFSATVVDPNGNLRFWTLQEYAATPENTWGTWWGSFILAPLSSPTVPLGLLASPVSGTAIRLNWTDSSSNEESFVIERETGPGLFSVIAVQATTDISAYADNTLSERTTYTYRVKARNALGESGYSNEGTATTLLSTPTNLTAIAASTSLVNLSWIDGSNLENGYVMERKTGTGGVYQIIATLPLDSRSYSDNTVSTGTTYFYRVKAFDNVTPTQSAYSNEATVSIPGGSVTEEGGGGGGCLAITPSAASTVDASSILSLLILFLPAAVYGWKRHPPC